MLRRITVENILNEFLWQGKFTDEAIDELIKQLKALKK